jgi:predicted nucleic-acid-binding protein
MRAIDTNVLVRLLTRDDPGQVSSAEAFITHGAWISHLVLLETSWVLASVYELDHAQIGKALEMLLNHKDLAVQEPETVAAALEQYQKHSKLGFSDCLILETAKKAGHRPLGTFDKDLGRLDGVQRL